MLPRSPRAFIFWLATIAVTIVTAVIIASDLVAPHRHATALGDERAAVFATHQLALGSVVAEQDARTRQIHSSQLPPGVLGMPAVVVGRVIIVRVVRGGYLAEANLAPRRRTGLDGALPAGTRAMRVVVTDAVRPRRRSAVDVYASLE